MVKWGMTSLYLCISLGMHTLAFSLCAVAQAEQYIMFPCLDAHINLNWLCTNEAFLNICYRRIE